MAKEVSKDFDKNKKLKKKIKKLQEKNILLRLELKKIENFYLNKIEFYKRRFNEEKNNIFNDFETLSAKYLDLLIKLDKSYL